jgi:hypothetical protein
MQSRKRATNGKEQRSRAQLNRKMSVTDVEEHHTKQATANLKMQIATIVKRRDTLLKFVAVEFGNRKHPSTW